MKLAQIDALGLEQPFASGSYGSAAPVEESNSESLQGAHASIDRGAPTDAQQDVSYAPFQGSHDELAGSETGCLHGIPALSWNQRESGGTRHFNDGSLT